MKPNITIIQNTTGYHAEADLLPWTLEKNIRMFTNFHKNEIGQILARLENGHAFWINPDHTIQESEYQYLVRTSSSK
jgi:hypothetical protein